ncbi:MAG: hypothetical protein HQ564_06240 [Candidatus Saganbacteria bacterium]|nr:hypothetical protein [Candidatus Saganbacteria bacterium]
MIFSKVISFKIESLFERDDLPSVNNIDNLLRTGDIKGDAKVAAEGLRFYGFPVAQRLLQHRIIKGGNYLNGIRFFLNSVRDVKRAEAERMERKQRVLREGEAVAVDISEMMSRPEKPPMTTVRLDEVFGTERGREEPRAPQRVVRDVPVFQPVGIPLPNDYYRIDPVIFEGTRLSGLTPRHIVRDYKYHLSSHNRSYKIGKWLSGIATVASTLGGIGNVLLFIPAAGFAVLLISFALFGYFGRRTIELEIYNVLGRLESPHYDELYDLLNEREEDDF